MIATLMSCESKDDRRKKPDKDYFPLQVGNQWIFDLSGRDSIKAIATITGIDYFEFASAGGTTSYYRKQDDRIYVRSAMLEPAEEMKFDLGADVNDEWAFHSGYVTLVSRNDIITIGNNQIDSCLYFYFHNEDLIDYNHSIWLAPGIGFVQISCQECFGSALATLKLKQARIDGRLITFE